MKHILVNVLLIDIDCGYSLEPSHSESKNEVYKDVSSVILRYSSIIPDIPQFCQIFLYFLRYSSILAIILNKLCGLSCPGRVFIVFS